MSDFNETIQKAIDLGLIGEENGVFVLTPKGQRYAEDLECALAIAVFNRDAQNKGSVH